MRNADLKHVLCVWCRVQAFDRPRAGFECTGLLMARATCASSTQAMARVLALTLALLSFATRTSNATHVGTARLYASYLPSNLLRVSVSLGNPESRVYALIDPSSSEIVLDAMPADDSAFNVADSSTFLSLGTAAAVRVRMRVGATSAEASAMASADANLIIGLGPGSALLRTWNCVTLTPSLIVLERDELCASDCTMFARREGTFVTCDPPDYARIFAPGFPNTVVHVQPLCRTGGVDLFVPGENVLVPHAVYAAGVSGSSAITPRSPTLHVGPFALTASTLVDEYRPRAEALLAPLPADPTNATLGALSIRALLGYHVTFNARSRTLCYKRVVTHLPVTQATAVLSAIICVLLLSAWLYADAQHTAAFTSQGRRRVVAALTVFAAAGTAIAATQSVVLTLSNGAMWDVMRDAHDIGTLLAVVHIVQAIVGGVCVSAAWAIYAFRVRRVLPLHLVAMAIEGGMWSALVLAQLQHSQGHIVSLSIALPLLAFVAIWTRYAALHVIVMARNPHMHISWIAVSLLGVCVTLLHLGLLLAYVFVPACEAFLSLPPLSSWLVGVLLLLLLALRALLSAEDTYVVLETQILARDMLWHTGRRPEKSSTGRENDSASDTDASDDDDDAESESTNNAPDSDPAHAHKGRHVHSFADLTLGGTDVWKGVHKFH